MIIVSLDLLPHGVPFGRKSLTTLEITNRGTGTKHLANYDYRILNADGATYRRGIILSYPRLKLSRWRLIQRCLNDAFGPDQGGE